MICARGRRVLRSGKEQDYSDRCWGKVFSVNELGEGIFLYIRHYDKLRESNETTCYFPQSSASDTCSGRLIKCPQRLITVFESLVDTNKLFLNPNICNKHLIQASYYSLSINVSTGKTKRKARVLVNNGKQILIF